jgi:tetratricopeptide (TPR) repeat protein
MRDPLDHEKAIEACTRAIQSLPEDAVSYFQRAYHLAATGLLAEALDDLTRAISFGLDEPEVFSFRANLLEAMGRKAEAEEEARLSGESLRSFEDLYNRAVLAFQNNKFKRAINSFTQALKLNRKSVAAWYGRGLCRHLHGDLKGAMKDYSKALRRKPDHKDALRQRASLYSVAGEWEKCCQDWSGVIECDPENAEAYYKRGRGYRALGKLKKALSDFRAALNIDDEIADAWFQTGVIHNHWGQHDVAIECLDHSLSIRPVQGAYAARSLARFRQGDHEGALEDCTEALEIGEDPLAYFIRAMIHAARLENKDAQFNFDQSIALDSTNGEVFRRRAELRRVLSNYEGAREDIKRAEELGG